MQHITVLKEEAVSLLALAPESVVIDATYGAGGHAKEICKYLSQEGTYVGLDADASAFLDSFLYKQESGPKFHLVHSNFAKLPQVARSLHIKKADAILADLGWRTDQFVSSGKGFSFANGEPLAMTYGDPADYLFTAADIVNGWAEEDIANVIYGYGEEKAARRIAKAIVIARQDEEISSAKQLAEIVAAAIPGGKRHLRIHPATKTFQALRIAVNDELSVLETFLREAAELLAEGGVLAIISFHSLEDRQVKLAFRALAATEGFEILTKKPIVASLDELSMNPRARSAKLRAIRKISETLDKDNLL
jgi:16S rRNA (cytosine1402-N4)-methyltransferase